MNRSYSLAQIAEIVGGTLRGRGETTVTGVADVAEASPNDVTWLTNPKYADKLRKSHAGAVVVAKDFGPTDMPAILCERVDRSVAKLLGAFAAPVSQPELGVHASAVIHSSANLGEAIAVGPHAVIDSGARIGARSIIHAGVFIGRETVIGEDCILWPNVVVRDRCTVGNRVIIHPNAVIGADGLGFYFDDGRHNKIPHIGGVKIEDDVEIGACTCIDRSKVGHTVIGRGTKIDNLVQVGHNARIGEHCVLVSMIGIAGSARIGRYCILGGRVSVVEHVSIGDGARVAACTLVTKDVPGGMTVSGSPAQEHRQEMRVQASLRRLPEMIDQLRDVIARVKRLETSTHH